MTANRAVPIASKKPVKPLRTLDLFSGIGGLTIALEPIATPLLYCDNYSPAKDVLTTRIQSGHLPPAPIHNDVRDLVTSWPQIQANQKQIKQDKKKSTAISGNAGSAIDASPAGPNAIVAGFPCIGFSVAGTRIGFKNDASSLFFQILGIIDHFKTIDFLFLENVPTVVTKGLDAITHELCDKRGYTLRWTLLSACELGGVQARRRWYAIAYKPKAITNMLPSLIAALDTSIEDGKNTNSKQNFIPDWTREPVPRLTVQTREDPNLKKAYDDRLGLLGNSVIPYVARQALRYLLQTIPKPVKPTFAQSHRNRYPRDGCYCPTAPVASINTTNRTNTTVTPNNATNVGSRGSVSKLAPNPYTSPCNSRDLNLIIDPNAFKIGDSRVSNQLSPRMGSELITKPYKKAMWGTPTAQSFWATNVLTMRSKNMLGTQLRFERTTPDHLRPGTTNPQFVEWMMGYPTDFTKV